MVYESIWTHYLKLFLGHAAYAQTLVLAIFMGGLAAGAWLAGKWSGKIKNPLAAYAVAELALGASAWAFHDVYVLATRFAYDAVMPALPSPLAAGVFQYVLSAALILPQTMVLGATFPLISAALIRAFPKETGFSLSMLYFTNSIGGAAGIIASGFFLIPSVGLPGTLFAASILNVLAGLAAWLLSRGKGSPALAAVDTAGGVHALRKVFLAAAFVTGASSFMYEVGWLRMLSLVLGASTHAFELMVGAFILGLAMGGFWIRRRIDALPDKTAFAGYVQLAMGLLALATLPVYTHSFDVMAYILKALPKTDGGYAAFNAASHLIAAAVMVPAAFCAGMTLPLFTAALISGGGGEKSIGEIYAFNTAGAIAGVAFAIYAGMPILGLKGLCIFGAALDAALGFLLLYHAGRSRRGAGVLAGVMAAGLAAMVAVPFKAESLASGVYRAGSPTIADSERIVFHKDGRTATVSLMLDNNGTLTVATNGKADASINILPDRPPSSDESTQTLLGAVPLLFNPGAASAVNIGMGSGFTTRVLLSSPSLRSLDTVEIEPAMVEAARQFRNVSAQAFSDPRSHIHINDAKAFFALSGKKFDIIVSEPSNPWVSGVSGLFSTEFYSLVSRYLNKGGVYIQWLHLYETDARLFASIVNAMDGTFSDWAIYSSHMSDVIIVARNEGDLPEASLAAASPELAALLARVGVRTPDDFRLLRLGSKKTLAGFFNHLGALPNSDYYPFLDTNSVKARYLQTNFFTLNDLRASPLPLLDMLEGTARGDARTEVTFSPYFVQHKYAVRAQWLRDFIMTGAPMPEDMPPDVREAALGLAVPGCGGAHDKALLYVARNTLAFLSEGELMRMWPRVTRGCGETDWLRLVKGLSMRNGAASASAAEKLLATADFGDDARLHAYVLKAGMLGHLAQGKNGAALDIFNKYAPDLFRHTPPDFTTLYLHRLAEK